MCWHNTSEWPNCISLSWQWFDRDNTILDSTRPWNSRTLPLYAHLRMGVYIITSSHSSDDNFRSQSRRTIAVPGCINCKIAWLLVYWCKRVSLCWRHLIWLDLLNQRIVFASGIRVLLHPHPQFFRCRFSIHSWGITANWNCDIHLQVLRWDNRS